MLKIKITEEKINLHPRNSHRFGYDFDSLVLSYPDLKKFVYTNVHKLTTIDFNNPAAVVALNTALLYANYAITSWEIPSDYLCPAVPGRADYLHYIADLLASTNNNTVPETETVVGLDIGMGANLIYPILGNSIYGWSFVGTDIDEKAVENCKRIIEKNPQLIDAISLQLQVEPRFIFKNIILPEDKFSFTICNPPFHNAKANATKSNVRKINNLNDAKITNAVLNFGGQNTELWCDGGEIGFITQMIYESAKYPLQVLWFTTLVSKKDNLQKIYKTLGKVSPTQIKTIEMAQGQKTSRIVAWSFQTAAQIKEWKF